jgi:hypothetical protein
MFTTFDFLAEFPKSRGVRGVRNQLAPPGIESIDPKTSCPVRRDGIRFIPAMQTLCRSIVVVALLGSLALPAGWCCWAVDTGAVSAGTAKSCCAHKPANSPPHSPVEPSCQCGMDDSVAIKQPSRPVVAPLTFAGMHSGWTTAAGAERSVPDLPSGEAIGPPIRVLLCVWRC